MIGKMLLQIGRIRAKLGVVEQVRFVPNTVGEFCNFYLRLN